jgi:hypothetical protein
VRLIGWPGARISVMGGEQAAATLLAVKRDQLRAQGRTLTAEEEQALTAPILAKYEEESSALYASARLWEDCIIDPVDTRRARPRARGRAARADPAAAPRCAADVSAGGRRGRGRWVLLGENCDLSPLGRPRAMVVPDVVMRCSASEVIPRARARGALVASGRGPGPRPGFAGCASVEMFA